MAKAEAQNVVDLGFNAKQFDVADAATFAEANGYVDLIVQAYGGVVSEAVGASFYSAATGADLFHITEAEKYLSAAELLRRLPNFEQAKMNSSRSAEATELENRRILERSKSADNTAAAHLVALGVDVEGDAGIATGFNEYNHFEASA